MLVKHISETNYTMINVNLSTFKFHQYGIVINVIPFFWISSASLYVGCHECVIAHGDFKFIGYHLYVLYHIEDSGNTNS